MGFLPNVRSVRCNVYSLTKALFNMCNIASWPKNKIMVLGNEVFVQDMHFRSINKKIDL